MERSVIKKVREEHAAMYAEKGYTERAREIAAAEDEYTPIFKPRDIHPEEEPALDELNAFAVDISSDLTILNKEMALAGERLNNLMNDTILRLSDVERDIAIEEERLKDLNMLCGDHSDFDSVETLTGEDFEEKTTEVSEGVFSAKVTSQSTTALQVLDVKGNGYEGNEFVYKDKRFVADMIDTSFRGNITNGRLNSVYEYSRISADKSEDIYFSLVNFDDIEAECSITLRASSPVSMIQAISDSESLILKEVSISDDGAIFRPVTAEELAFNDKDNIYKNGTYAFGTGLICFPSTRFMKLSFRSNGHTDDKIAFVYYDAKLKG
ncbi:hypothetical protein [Bacillus atrophaeus]|uniref:hypothetical protein n=1 Tax=Bacillus atrophaeus TaxID=1452 RepID=UPI002E225124|nr:hypothetical protein [Bacillus atrophaeus]